MATRTGSKMPNASFSNGVQFAFDATTLSLIETCPYKYWLKMHCGWAPKRKSVHLFFGGEYAHAIEHYHRARAAGATHDDAQRLVVREALQRTWFEDGPWVSDHNSKTRENLIRTIVWYTEHFLDDPMQIITLADGKPAVELSFRMSITDEIVFCGHIDRLVEYSGDIYVQDQKTTGSTVTQKYYEGWSPDVQMSMYTFAARSLWATKIRGVVLDVAQIAVGFSRFERGFIFRSGAQLEEWYRRTLRWIDFIRDATRQWLDGTPPEVAFPMNTTSCGNYGGCEFRHICSRSPEVREQFLKGDFEQRPTWDPMESR